MTPQVQDYIRVAITIVFLGVFVYEVVTGQAVNPLVERYLIVLIGFYFGIDRLGDFAGKFITRQKGINELRKRDNGG